MNRLRRWCLAYLMLAVLSTSGCFLRGSKADYWAALATIVQPQCAPAAANSAAHCSVINTPDLPGIGHWSTGTTSSGDYQIDIWLRGVPAEAGLQLKWVHLDLFFDAEWIRSDSWVKGEELAGPQWNCKDAPYGFELAREPGLDCDPSGKQVEVSGDVHLASIRFTRLVNHPRLYTAGSPDPNISVILDWERRNKSVGNDVVVPTPEPFTSSVSASDLETAKQAHEAFKRALLTSLELPQPWHISDLPSNDGLQPDQSLACGVRATDYLDRGSKAATFGGSDIRTYNELLLQFRGDEVAQFFRRLTDACATSPNLLARLQTPAGLGDESASFLLSETSYPLGDPFTQFVVVRYRKFIAFFSTTDKTAELINTAQQLDVAHAGTARLIQIAPAIPID